MVEPVISSDPQAWLRPHYAALTQRPAFALLEPALRAEALAAAIEPDYPVQAAEIRAWDVATRAAMLVWLEDVTPEKPAVREITLWRMRRDACELSCVAVYMPAGIDLRLFENGEMRQTELFGDAPTLQGRARQWRRGFAKAGWSEAELHPAAPDGIAGT